MALGGEFCLSNVYLSQCFLQGGSQGDPPNVPMSCVPIESLWPEWGDGSA